MKRLYRSKRDRVLGGVASGIAEYFDVDPTVIRIVWVLAALAGIGVLGYLVAWIIIPEAPLEAGAATPLAAPVQEIEGIHDFDEHRRRDRHARFIGISLIVIGGWILLRRIFPHALMDRIWPLALVLLGVYILASSVKKR